MARIKYWDEESQTWKYADKSLGVNIDLTEYAKKEDIPTKLPNPNALNFTGAVNATYDGSVLVEVEIPSSGGGSGDKWRKIASITLEEELATFKITEDENGNPFNLKKLMVVGVLLPCVDVTNNYAVKMVTDSDTTNMWGSSSGQICSSPKNTETRRSFISMREVIYDGLIYNESQVSYNAGSISDSTGYNGVGQTAPVNIVRLDGEQLALGDQKKIDCVWIGSYTLCLGIGSRFEIFGVDS